MSRSSVEPVSREPIVRRSRHLEQGFELWLHVPESLDYFRGHFPGFAVLPGVVEIDWALLLARRYLAMPAGAAVSMRVKFAKPIRPGAELKLALEYSVAARELRFAYSASNFSYGSGRIEIDAG